MEKRAIRTTIELPEDLTASPEVAMSRAEAAGVSAPVAGVEPVPAQGPSPISSGGARPEPAGGPIDAGAAPPHLIAALGGEAALPGRAIGTEGDGTGSGAVGGMEGGLAAERAIDAGPLPDHVASLLEASGPRHPMADSPDFRAALTVEDAFHRN
jgi:hypothetical protein